jgi:hypothetical protein
MTALPVRLVKGGGRRWETGVAAEAGVPSEFSTQKMAGGPAPFYVEWKDIKSTVQGDGQAVLHLPYSLNTHSEVLYYSFRALLVLILHLLLLL